MRNTRWLLLLALPALFTLSERWARADSVLFERITGNGAPIDTPLTFIIPADGVPHLVTVPALTIDFLEDPTSGLISDRFHFDDYTVTVTSVQPNQSLAPRGGSIMIPGSVELMGFTAFSAGEGDTSGLSDTIRFRLAGGVDFTFPTFDDPSVVDDGVGFIVFTRQYDVVRGDGTVSDYINVSDVTGFFQSADDQSVYDPNLIVNATLVEDRQTGGTMVYSLNFVTTPVPEPASLLLFGGGLAGLGAYTWRKRRSQG